MVTEKGNAAETAVRTDVLIVGAGPAGLTLAILLLQQGVRARVIDRMRRPSPLSRAIGVHARTLESLEPQGVTARLVEAGVRLERVQMWSGGKAAVDVGLSGLPTRYPFVLSIPQSATEEILLERLTALGGEVERGVELQSFTQDAAGISATLSTGPARARWLVGCDGAHSTVRHGLGLSFDGHPYAERLVLGDVRWDTDLPRDRLSVFLDHGFLACFPLPDGVWRLIATERHDASETQVVQTGTAGHGQTGAELPLEELAALAALRSGRPGAMTDPGWLARFHIHARQVPRYRIGRVFLAGDAAHIHSPVGAQGMNTGIQDAINLGWKLALACRAESGGQPVPELLLDSYHAERHPVAAAVLRATGAATRIGLSRNPLLSAVRGTVAGFVSGLEPVRDRLTKTLAELDVCYTDSPVVRGSGRLPDVGPGERLPVLPPHGGHEMILLQGPRCSAAGRRRLRICAAIGKEAGFAVSAAPEVALGEEDALLVVRPDGYAGLCLNPADPEALVGWLDLTGISALTDPGSPSDP